MPLTRMSTRQLISAITIVALALGLLIQHQRTARREMALRAQHNERLQQLLVELRDLRGKEHHRLEEEFLQTLGSDREPKERSSTVAQLKDRLARDRGEFDAIVNELKQLQAQAIKHSGKAQ